MRMSLLKCCCMKLSLSCMPGLCRWLDSRWLPVMCLPPSGTPGSAKRRCSLLDCACLAWFVVPPSPMQDGQFEQAVGIALESRRLDQLERAITASPGKQAWVNVVLDVHPCCCTVVCLADNTAATSVAAAAAAAAAVDAQLLPLPGGSIDTINPFCLLPADAERTLKYALDATAVMLLPERSQNSSCSLLRFPPQTRSARSSTRWMSASGWWCPASSGTRWACAAATGMGQGCLYGEPLKHCWLGALASCGLRVRRQVGCQGWIGSPRQL